METLETKLFEAASTGDVRSLQTLLNEDRLILDRISVDCNISDPPLHVAAMLGHTDFVKEIIRLKPQLTSELNSRQLWSPLHLASAKGHVDIVRALLAVNPQMGLARDKNGLVPIHLAAIKGRIEVLKILLQAEPDAARLDMYKGETILHLCIRFHQLEALKLVVNAIGGLEQKFLNAKDSEGNTVLHLAVEDKQVEAVNFLMTLSGLEANTTNHNGMTAVDALLRSKKDVRDSEIEKILRNSETNILSSARIKRRERSVKDEWFDKKRSALMVVASLIATMCFEAGVNPPSGVWQDDSPGNHKAGYSVLAHIYPSRYIGFCIVNTVGFVSSLSIIMLLMSGFPMRRRFFMWVLTVITWVAITAVAFAYVIAIFAVTPSDQETAVMNLVGYSVMAWDALMAMLIIGHTIRLVVKVMRTIVKSMCPPVVSNNHYV